MIFGGLNSMLETYSGRDKIIRLLCYTTKLVGGFKKNDKLLKFSNLMSECRTTLRLFDDIPMLYYSLSYGLGRKTQQLKTQNPNNHVNITLGECEIEKSHTANILGVTVDSHLKWDDHIQSLLTKIAKGLCILRNLASLGDIELSSAISASEDEKSVVELRHMPTPSVEVLQEPDTYMQVCGVVVNALDQLYYPCEHVAWAADKGLVTLRSDPWWMASNVCWTFSLYFNIARSLRYLTLLHEHNKHLDLSDTTMREEYKKNSRLQLLELLTSVRCACDLVHAIHWMPEGFMWSGRLEQWHIGALGTVSSLLSILQSTVLKKSS